MPSATQPAAHLGIHPATTPRPLRWLDPLMALGLVGAVLMALTTALPAHAWTSERVVGNGQAASEQRQPTEFDAVQTHSLTVVVRQGSAASVTVQADSNLLPLLETVVEKGALVVRWQKGSNISTRVKPVVTVTAVKLASLAVLGSGDLSGDQLRTPALACRVDGSGDLRLTGLTTDALTVAISGSGDVQAAGSATRLQISIAGSGDVKTRDLKADEVKVRIAGSGDADVQAQRTLEVAIAGSGDVVWTGAASLKKSIAGSGSITRR